MAARQAPIKPSARKAGGSRNPGPQQVATVVAPAGVMQHVDELRALASSRPATLRRREITMYFRGVGCKLKEIVRRRESCYALSTTPLEQVASMIEDESKPDTPELARSGLPGKLHEETSSSLAGPDPMSQPLAEIRALLEQLHRRHDVIERQIAELRDHSNLVGYLVEKLLAGRTRRPWVPQSAREAFGRRAAPYVRAFKVIVRPRVSWRAIEAASRSGRLAARRSVWSEKDKRWRQKLDYRVWIRSVWRGVRGLFADKDAPIYRIRQREATVGGARPRIMHAIPNVYLGGSTQLIVDLFDFLGHKYEMQVMTSALPAGQRHEGMIIHELREPTTVEAIYDLLTKFQPDVVHVSYWGDVDTPWYDKVFAAASRYGCKIIENVNTPVVPYRQPDIVRFIYVSEYVRREFGSNSPHEIVIHPGIDLERFAPPTNIDLDAANSVGMVYRLEPDKLNIGSIEPLIQVVKARPRTRVVIVGNGSLFEPFLQRVTAAGVRDNFVFTGYVPYSELPAYYRMFRIFVAPVWKESFGQVAPFAMNMGMAVAGYNVGALSEILGYEDTLGSSVEECARKIVELLDSPAQAEHYGRLNRERAQAHYAIEAMCRAYDRVYRSALGVALDLMPGFPQAELFPDADRQLEAK